MKKYLFGMIAIALAVSISSFKTTKTTFSSTLFYQLSSFAQSDVENPANYKNTNSITCDGGSVKACELLTVPAADINIDGTLKSTVTITSATSDATNYYVSDISDASITPKNKN